MASPLAKQVKAGDVALGGVLALVLGGLFKFGLSRVTLPAAVTRWLGPASTGLAAVLLYLVEHSSSRARAEGHLTGGALAAGLPVFWQALGAIGPKVAGADGNPVPVFSDYVSVPGYGLLTADMQVMAPPQHRLGLLTTDYSYRGNEDWDPMSAP